MRQFVTDIPETEFNAFAQSCPYHHYTKTTMYAHLKEAEHYQWFAVGMKEDGQLIATALILRKRIWYLGSYYCYVPYGYNLDYQNRELLHQFNQELTAYCTKQLHAFFVRIDPNVCRYEHEKNGQIKEGGFNNEWTTEALQADGFTHLGYNYGYSGNWMSRFTYLLDLSPELTKIQKNIKNYNNHMRKNKERCVSVYEGTRRDLKILYEAQLVLAKKDRFVPKPLSYFERLYDSFAGNDHLYIVQADLAQAYQNVLAERDALLNMKPETLGAQKQKEREAGLTALNREIAMMEAEDYAHQGVKILGAKFIIQLGDKVFNVNMYTHKILPNFRVALALHAYAIEESKKREAKSYDFEGVSGSLDPKDSYYGIHDFKRSFGGDFLEFIGEFDYISDPTCYRLFRKIDRLYRRIRRKLYLLYKGW